MDFGLSVDRPGRLPIFRKTTHTEEIRNSLRKAIATKGKKDRLVFVARFERSECERLIYEEFDSALQGDYSQKCDFLNRLHRLVLETFPDSLNDGDFFEMMCDKMLLVLKDDHPAIRAMCFRILRLCNCSERQLVIMLTSHVDMYAIRAVDLRVDNDMERCQALQLLASMFEVYQTANLKKLIEASRSQKNGKKYAFPKSIMQPIIAIALGTINTTRHMNEAPAPPREDSVDEEEEFNKHDKLALPCLSLFLEFCVYEPELILQMAGTDWMVKVLTGTAAVSRRIASLVGRVLVNWLDDPMVRVKAQLHLVLEQIFAPLIEFGFFSKAGTDMSSRVVDSVMENFSYSFLGILRSWSGLFSCAAVGPNSAVIASSPLRLLEYLGLGTVDNAHLSRVRDMVVDICCDFMDLPYASKTFTNWEDALQYYGSISTPDHYSASLKDDFVLAQSDLIISNDPEFANHVDLLSSFRAFAFFVLVNAGLPQSVSRLIVAQPNAPSAIKAQLLMSDMLRTAPSIIPSGLRASVLSMPTLMQSACESLAQCKAAAATHGYYDEDMVDSFTYINAENAELVLHRFDMLNRVWIHNATVKPAPDSDYSLFLDREKADEVPFRWAQSEDCIESMLEDCSSSERLDLNSVCMLFSTIRKDILVAKEVDKIDLIVEIVERVLTSVCPTKGIQQNWRTSKAPVLAARNAIFLSMDLLEMGCCPKLEELLIKYANAFKIEMEKQPMNTGLFSPKNLVFGSTMYHFSLIGALSSHSKGSIILEKGGVYNLLLDSMHKDSSPEFVKLVVSCLDYTVAHTAEHLPFIILQKALISTNEPCRRWCTRFLSTLASLRLPEFGDWGIRLLIGRMGDSSVKVVRHAVRILQAWLPMYPEGVTALRSIHLESFGDAGILLKSHIFSNELMCERNEQMVLDAVNFWMQFFNMRYFEALDEEMRVALLSIRRSMSGDFSRSSGERLEKYGVRTPVHLFAVLSAHSFGRTILKDERIVSRLLSQIGEDRQPEETKAAVVALAQIATNNEGFLLLPPDAVPRIIRLAEEAQVLSVRGAAFWAVNILASSEEGCRIIAEFGWESNKNRYIVDKVRREHDAEMDAEHSQRRMTAGTPLPEISVDYRLGTPTPMPLSETRRRASSEATAVSETSRPSIRKSRSDLGLSYIVESGSYSESDSYDTGDIFRFDRMMTAESGVTSTIGSMADDSVGCGYRRRATTTTGSIVDETEIRTRSSTIAHCITNGLKVDKTRLEAEGQAADLTREPHFSSRNREKWRLTPLRVRRYLQVNRNVGDPVRYVYMTKDEEEAIAHYQRGVFGDENLWNQLNHTGPRAQIYSMHTAHIIALPSDVEMMCLRIFSTKSRNELLFAATQVDTEDRGTKSGHSRSHKAHLAGHSTYRCFYCSENRKKFKLPTDVDVALLRRQVLNEVDMLEVLESAPEKKLLSLRSKHPWLFEWPCMYADVLELLDEYRFKPRSRAFLQEIFYHALKLEG